MRCHFQLNKSGPYKSLYGYMGKCSISDSLDIYCSVFTACNTIYGDILADKVYPTTFLFSAYNVIERTTHEK